MLEDKKKPEKTDEELLSTELRYEEEVLIEADNDFQSDDTKEQDK